MLEVSSSPPRTPFRKREIFISRKHAKSKSSSYHPYSRFPDEALSHGAKPASTGRLRKTPKNDIDRIAGLVERADPSDISHLKERPKEERDTTLQSTLSPECEGLQQKFPLISCNWSLNPLLGDDGPYQSPPAPWATDDSPSSSQTEWSSPTTSKTKYSPIIRDTPRKSIKRSGEMYQGRGVSFPIICNLSLIHI